MWKNSSNSRFLRRTVPVAVGIGMIQGLLLLVGWFVLYGAIHKKVASSVEDVIIDANSMAAQAIAEMLGAFPDDLSEGSPGWDRAQSLIEEVELPGAGFACLLDEEGFIARHPDLRSSPGLREVNLGSHVLHGDGEGAGSDLSEVEASTFVNGTVNLGLDGKHYISTLRDPASGAQLVVHQPVSGITAARENFTSGMLLIAGLIGSAICGLTTLLGYLLVRSHNGAIEDWNRTLESRVAEQADQIREAHQGIIFGIAKLAEYRDNETGMHVERMCSYSATLAAELQRRGADIESDWIEQLRLAASLHDIGKVAIPDQILLKPGKLSVDEFEIMKTHAGVGCEALEAVRERVGQDALLDLGIEIAGGHHEKWDGSGYPRGIQGSEIPLSARIVAVADVFDALMSKRVYKAAMPFEQVCEIIEEGRGKHFDPEVVDAFHAVSGELLETRRNLQDVEDAPSLSPSQESAENSLAA